MKRIKSNNGYSYVYTSGLSYLVVRYTGLASVSQFSDLVGVPSSTLRDWRNNSKPTLYYLLMYFSLSCED